MSRKLFLILVAIILFYISKIQFQEISETGCVRAKFGLMLCDWTKYAWACSPGLFGLLCIWALFGDKNKAENQKQEFYEGEFVEVFQIIDQSDILTVKLAFDEEQIPNNFSEDFLLGYRDGRLARFLYHLSFRRRQWRSLES